MRGWRFPGPLLAEPRERKGINPFTKEPFSVRTRVPEPPPAPLFATARPQLHKLPAFKEAPTSCGTCLEPFFACELGLKLGLWSQEECYELGGRLLVGPKRTKYQIDQWALDLTTALSRLDDETSCRLVQSIEDEVDDCSKHVTWRRGWLDALVATARLAVETRREMYDFFVDG
jgi:hypothetical protein